eukprot:361960-Chlamydomonas_euryale.AAC.5
MCWRKMWRVYQRGLERWIIDVLQPVLDECTSDGTLPRFVQVWKRGGVDDGKAGKGRSGLGGRGREPEVGWESCWDLHVEAPWRA